MTARVNRRVEIVNRLRDYIRSEFDLKKINQVQEGISFINYQDAEIKRLTKKLNSMRAQKSKAKKNEN